MKFAPHKIFAKLHLHRLVHDSGSSTSDCRHPHRMADTFGSAVVRFHFTIIKANGLKQGPGFLHRYYAIVQCGDQVRRTKVTWRGQPTWNESFNLEAKDAQQVVTIAIYQQFCARGDVLIGEVSELLHLESEGKELTRFIPSSEQQSPTSVTFRVANSTPKCHTHGLIIGINKYKSPDIRDLNGCVNDTMAIGDVFSRRFRVPESQLAFLTNEMATRDAIISAFEQLIRNDQIEHNDAIVIFYAGHGSRVEAPASWTVDGGYIETICPHDQGLTVNERLIHGIPDRTINALLQRLAAAKGNNITVIMDACHSGVITRNCGPADVPGRRARSTPIPDTIPDDLDVDIWGLVFRSASVRATEGSLVATPPFNLADRLDGSVSYQGIRRIPGGFKYLSSQSHVLLTACADGENAIDDSFAKPPCGIFTNELVRKLTLLEESGLTDITYFELLADLALPGNQHPQCVGSNRHRFLFNVNSPGRDARAFMLTQSEEGEIEVNAGRIHGVVKDTEFSVQPVDVESSAPLHILVAVDVKATSSVLEKQTPNGSGATMSNWNHLPRPLNVFIEPGCAELTRVVSPGGSTTSQPNQTTDYSLVNSPSEAHISLAMKGKDLLIERLQQFFPIPVSDTALFKVRNQYHHVPSILAAILNFHHNLSLHPILDTLEGLVTLELYRLMPFTPGRPREPDLQHGNLLIRDQVSFVQGTSRYGIAIVNRSTHDLFPYLFYFDPFEYSVQVIYAPSSPTIAPLPSAQMEQPTEITVGYGKGGGEAIIFTLKDGEESDTGFIKLFVSSTYVNMSHVAQGFPFSRRGYITESPTDIWSSSLTAVTVLNNVVASETTGTVQSGPGS